MATSSPATLTFREWLAKFPRVPDSNGQLRSLLVYPALDGFVDAYDARDPLTGLSRFTELGLFLIKKAGKSTMAGALVDYELVAGTEPDREIIIVASDLAQSKDIVFASAVRFVRRHPWLSKHVKVLSRELVYRQTVTDPRTGGRHVQEHVARAVPARDARSLHGVNPCLVVIDEAWAQNDYAVIEALAPSPTRRVSRTVYCTYAGLRSSMHAGNPLWDLWQRWQRGDDPGLHVTYVGGPEGWRSVPWIKPSFIESQRRKFAAVPSKFRRLWLNEWTVDDTGSFLTGEEIAAAVDDTLIEPERGEAGIAYTVGVDLGLTHDWSAVVVSHVATDHRLVVDAVRFWRGTRQRPVSIAAVEEELVAISKRFRIARTVMDMWQSAYLRDRLEQRGVPNCFMVAVDPSRLDRMATLLKRTFSARQIRLPRHPQLVEQLETIVGAEQKRRDLVRFTSGAGQEAGRHDDIVVALCLSMESQTQDIGRAQLPQAFNSCYRASSVPMDMLKCYLFGGSMPGVGGDPSCKACPGHRYVKEHYAKFVEGGGEAIGLRRYRQLQVLDNDWVSVVLANRDGELMGL